MYLPLYSVFNSLVSNFSLRRLLFFKMKNSVDTGMDNDVSATAMYDFKPGAQILIFLTVPLLCVIILSKECGP